MNPAATDTEEFMAPGNLILCDKNESLGNPHKVVIDISNYVTETISENQPKNYSVHQKKEGLVDILVRSADECVGLFPNISENQLSELYSDPITETKADITWEDSILHCIQGEEADSEATIFASLNTDLNLMKSAINPTTRDFGLPPLPPKDVNMYPPGMCLGVILEIVADVTKSVSDDQLRDSLYWENVGPGKILEVVGGVSESTYRDISEKHSSESKSDMASEDVRPNYTNNKDDANGNDVNLSCVNTDMDLNNLNLDALTVDIANLIGLRNSSRSCSPNSEPGNLVEGERAVSDSDSVDDSKIINQPSANQLTGLFSDPALESEDELGMVGLAGEDGTTAYVACKEADVRSVTADEMDIININSTGNTTTKDELSMVGMRMAGEDSMPGYVTSKEVDVKSVTADEMDIISISSTRNTTTTADTEDSIQLKDTSMEQQNDRLGIILGVVGGISESIYENISGNHLTEMYTAVPAHAQETEAEVYTDIATDDPRHSFLHSRDQENKAGKVDPVHHLNRSVTKTSTTDCGEVIIHQDASLVYLQKQGIGDALIRVDDGFGDLNTDGSCDNTNCIPPQLRPFFASLLQSAYLTNQANASLMETLTLSKHSMGLRDGELQYDGWNNVRKCLQGKSQLLDNMHHSLLLMIQQLLDQVHHVHRNEGDQQSTGQELSSEQDVTMEAFESFLQGKVKADQPKEPSAVQRMTAESNLLEGTHGLVQKGQRDPLHGMHSRQEQTRQPTKPDGGYSVDSAGKASLKALQKRNCSRERTHVANCYGQKSLFVNKIGEVVQVPHASIHGDACETLNLQYPDKDIHQKEALRVSHELEMSHGTQSKTSDQQLKNMDNTLNLDVPSLKNCYSKNKDSEGKFETMPLVAMRSTSDVRLARITSLAIQYGSYHPWDSYSSPHWNHSMRNRIIHSALSSSYTNKACTKGFGLVTNTTSAWLEDAITHSTTEISMGSILHSEKTSSTTMVSSTSKNTSKNTKASTNQISRLQTAAVNDTSQLPMGISQTSKMEVNSDTDPARCTPNRILHGTEREITNTSDAVQLSRTTSSNGDSETGDFVHENGSSRIRSCRCHCGAYFNSLQSFQQHLDRLHHERQMMFVCKFTICKGRVFDAREKEEYKMHLTDVHHVSEPYLSEPVLLQYSKLCPHLTVNNILASESSAVTCLTREISSIRQTGDECSDLRWNTNRDDAYAQDTSKRSRDLHVKYYSSVKKTIDMDGSIIEDEKLRNDSKNVCKDSSELSQAEHSKRTRCHNTKLCERKRILCNDTSKMSSSKTLKGSDASQESKLAKGPVLARKSCIHKKGTYKCSNCGNGFRSLHALHQHEFVHTNEGLGYICDEGKCNGHAYFLNRKNDFMQHLQNVHKIKKPVILEPIMLRFSKIGNMKRTAIRLFNTASPKKYSQQESTHVELCTADIEKAKNNSDSNIEENICNATGCSKVKAIVSESKQCDQVMEKQQTKCPGPPVPVKMAENVTQHGVSSLILRSMNIHEVRDQTAELGCLSEPEVCVHETPSLESHRGQAEPENLSSLCRRKDSRRIQGTKKRNCRYRKRLRSSSVISSRQPSSCVRADSRQETSGDVSVNTDKESVLKPDKPEQTKLNSAKMKKRISVCNVSSSKILKGVNCKNQNVQQSSSRHNLNSMRTKYQLVKRGKMKTSIHSVALRRRNGTNSKGGCDGGRCDGNKSKLLKKTYQSRSELITNNNTGRISKHRPYNCSTCGACLKSSGSLHHHADIHRTVGLGYLCDDDKCNGHAFFYNRKNDYFRHLQTVHKIKKPILPAPEMLWFSKLGNSRRSAVRIHCAESVEKPSSQENPQVELRNQDTAGRECGENNSEGNTKAIDSKCKFGASVNDQWKQVVEAQQANCSESSPEVVMAEEDDDQQMNFHPPTSQNSNLVEIPDDAQDQNGGMRYLDEYKECQGMEYCLNRKTDRKTHLQNSCIVHNPVLQDTVKLNYSKAATKKRDQIIGIPLKQATSTDSRHELLPFSYHSLRSPIIEIADRKKKNSYLFTKQFRSKSDIKSRRFASPARQSPRNHHSKYLNINNKETAFRHCEPARTKAVSKDQKGKTALCNTSSSKRFNDINNKLKNGHKKNFQYRDMMNAKQSSCQYKRIKKASLKTRSGRSRSVEGSGYDCKEAKLVETPDPIENQQTKNCSTSKRHNKGIYKCRSCDSILKSASKLLQHEERHRKVGLGYLCNNGKCIARAFFDSRKTDFMRHQQNVHKIKKPVIPEPIMLRFTRFGNRRCAVQIHNTASVEEASQQENALGEFCNQTIAGAANVESACTSSGSDIVEANVRSTDCKLKPAASEDKQCKQVVEGQQDKYAESTQVMRMKESYGSNSPVSGSLKPLESQNQKEGLGYLCEYESCQRKAYHINRKSDYRIHLLKVHKVINPVFQERVMLKFSKSGTKKTSPIIGIQLDKAASIISYPATESSTASCFVPDRSPIVQRNKTTLKDACLQTKQNNTDMHSINSSSSVSYASESARHDSLEDVSINADEDNVFMASKPSVSKHPLAKCYPGMTSICNVSSSNNLREVTSPNNNLHISLHSPTVISERASFQSGIPGKAVVKMVHCDTSKAQNWKYLKGGSDVDIESKLAVDLKTTESQRFKKCHTSKMHRNVTYKCSDCGCCFTSAESFRQHEDNPNKASPGFICRNNWGQRQASFLESALRIKNPVTTDPMLQFLKGTKRWCIVTLDNPAPLQTRPQQETIQVDLNRPAEGAIIEDIYDSHTEENVVSIDHNKAKQSVSEGRSWDQVTEEPRTMEYSQYYY